MKLIRLIGNYVTDFIAANITIARQVLSRRIEIEPETIVLDTEIAKPSEILALSNMITFTPGTLTLEIEPGKKLVVHALDDSEGARKAVRERLEQPLLAITRKKST